MSLLYGNSIAVSGVNIFSAKQGWWFLLLKHNSPLLYLFWVYSNKGWFASLELRFAGDQTRLAQGDKDDNRIGKSGTAAWQIANIHGGYEYKWLNINLSAQNLTNKDYRTHGSGINGVGRSLWLTLNVEI